jgi:ribonucleoside-diphosphate reductase alpha chain
MIPRPVKLVTFTEAIKTGCGRAYITATPYVSGQYFEISGLLGKSGNCSAAQCDALGCLITELVNHGGDPKTIARSLSKIRCPQDSKFLKSCAAAFADVLLKATTI